MCYIFIYSLLNKVISILNETGQIQLETLGKKQESVLAESLVEFLSKLTPVLPNN